MEDDFQLLSEYIWWPEFFVKMYLQWKTSEANQLTAILQVNTTINLEIKVTYNCAIGQELVLFNNKEILVRS